MPELHPTLIDDLLFNSPCQRRQVGALIYFGALELPVLFCAWLRFMGAKPT